MFSNIPHVKQPKGERSCGAACIKMLYEHRGISALYKEIWQDISLPGAIQPLNRYCRNGLIIRHLIKNGFQAVGVSVCDVQAVLAICEENGMYGLLNHRLSAGSIEGHYSIYLYSDYKGIHINDPEKPAGNRVIRDEEMRRLMADTPPSDEIVQKNTLILINMAQQKLPVVMAHCGSEKVEILECVKNHTVKVLCHYHGRDGHWIDFHA